MNLVKQKRPSINRLFQLSIKRSMCEFESNYHLFKNYFGLHQYKAKEYITENNLNNIQPKNVMSVVNYCERLGFTKEDILRNPLILRIHPISLDQYYTVMIEGGFTKIDAFTLSKFRTLCRRTVEHLKTQNLIHIWTDVAASFTKHLNPCPSDFKVRGTTDLEPWSQVHLKVLTEYLKWRLKIQPDDISKLVRIHPAIRRKSFKNLCENIVLAEELGFSNVKMLKYGYILHAYPKNTRRVLEEFPEIAGVPMKKAMRMYPKLVTASASNIKAILDILKEHNISDQAIAKRLNIFQLSPETVQFRLKELERIDDLKVLLNNPNILRLIVHHNRAKSRLSFLKEQQLKCATVTMLGTDDVTFDNQIKEGRDANSHIDIYAFLKGIFQTNRDAFDKMIKKHPYYLQVPLTVMEDTYYYLISENFSKSAILEVVYILLYPKEKIKHSLQQIAEYEISTSQTLTQTKKLNLVLYFIEKEHHFTGDGVWTKTELTEEHIHSS